MGVGKGIHSTDGHARIKPAIEQLMSTYVHRIDGTRNN